jgi:hypothetical protein
MAAAISVADRAAQHGGCSLEKIVQFAASACNCLSEFLQSSHSLGLWAKVLVKQ